MTRDEALGLLELARGARWTFPSSSGRPVGREPEAWVERLVAAKPEFVLAARLLVAEGEADVAAELAARVWRLWILTRDVAAGRAFLAGVLDVGGAAPTRWRALALYGDGLLAFWQGAQADVRARNEAALAVARASADPEALALAALGVSRAALSDGDHERALAFAIEARAHARTLLQAMPALGQAPLHMHAQAKLLAGDLDAAAPLFAESLALNRDIADGGMVVVELHNLGHVEVRRGNVDAAERLFDECARLSAQDDPYAKAFGALNQAAVAWGRRDLAAARTLFERAESILREAGADPAEESDLRWLRERLAAAPPS